MYNKDTGETFDFYVENVIHMKDSWVLENPWAFSSPFFGGNFSVHVERERYDYDRNALNKKFACFAREHLEELALRNHYLIDENGDEYKTNAYGDQLSELNRSSSHKSLTDSHIQFLKRMYEGLSKNSYADSEGNTLELTTYFYSSYIPALAMSYKWFGSVPGEFVDEKSLLRFDILSQSGNTFKAKLDIIGFYKDENNCDYDDYSGENSIVDITFNDDGSITFKEDGLLGEEFHYIAIPRPDENENELTIQD